MNATVISKTMYQMQKGIASMNINMIATSEIRITVLVNSEDAVRAMNAVHDAFGLAEA